MYKIFKIAIVFSVLLSITPHASAQGYKGGYSKEKKQKTKNLAAKPIPKVFSSKFVNTHQMEKLDRLYYNLFSSLLTYVKTGYVYQKKLYSQIKPEKFKTTRYSKEFEADMSGALDNLNKNYAKTMSNIENANKKYIEIKESIKAEDHEVLDALWEEKVTKFQEKSDTYFQMEFNFLSTYKNLVGFILKQGGKYYYKASDKKIYFYKFGTHQRFTQYIDKLNMIRFKKRKLIRTMSL